MANDSEGYNIGSKERDQQQGPLNKHCISKASLITIYKGPTI